MKKLNLLIIFVLSGTILLAQKIPVATNASARINNIEKHKLILEKSLVSEVKFRSVGPTIMSGRVTDIAIDPNDATHFYVAYASGGLWETHNNGMSFSSLFDNEQVMSIGAIAINWKDSIIWIGTGEANSSRSSYSGFGIYKSTNNGKTWENKGLYDSQHIANIVLSPADSNIILVAALGHLYSKNTERGVFKSTDGGESWNKTLYINNETGAVDLVFDPNNSNIIYASTWDKDRKAWNFTESGSGSGIYKSVDAGDNWTLISTNESGLPTGEGMGRIGLAISKNNSNVIYAYIDNQNHRPVESEKEAKDVLTKDELSKMSKNEFLKLDSEIVFAYLEKYQFPKEYGYKEIREMIETGQIMPIALADYVEDANRALFDTPVIGAEIYKSVDGGIHWLKTHEGFLDDLVYSYGYYFGGIKVSPFNDDEIYVLGVPILKSIDGGKTFKSLSKENVHSDHHALWIDPNYKGHLINGNDGGINITYDDGKTWLKANTPAVGQFYSVNFDMEEPYNVYGGIQDNGVWVGPSNYKANLSWQASGKYPYKALLGGDGMQVEVDTRDNNTIYAGFQFGNYFRIDRSTGKTQKIKPIHKLGEKPLRFNWQTPIHLSKHNQDILYMGSNKFHRSMDKGDHFETLSGDLTKGYKEGDVAYGTITTIDESPLHFGLIYIGTDDGYIQKSTDGGYSWENITGNLPPNLWVSRVTASTHNEKVVFASLNGYRWDDFDSYLFRSVDYGNTWQRIGFDLPMEPVNVVKEDPNNQNILYVGTDHGLYISIDWGESFMAMNNGLPAVAIHDLAVQPRDKDLIVGTHGRSIYIANVDEIELLTDSILDKGVYLFKIEPITYSKRWGSATWSKWYGYYEPSVEIACYLNSADSIEFKITDMDNMLLFEKKFNGVNGLNYLNYDLTVNPEIVESYQASLNEELETKVEIKKADNGKYYLHPGNYNIIVSSGNYNIKKEFKIVNKNFNKRPNIRK
ncbi:MAG: glycosyl hydrolase [Chlorobi bacterium]|nr:glycosyl hydrolase [Chlorobiota bacterium]